MVVSLLMNIFGVGAAGFTFSGEPAELSGSARAFASGPLLPRSYFYFYSYPRSFADRPGEASE